MKCTACVYHTDIEKCPHLLINSDHDPGVTAFYNKRVVCDEVEDFCDSFKMKSLVVAEHVPEEDLRQSPAAESDVELADCYVCQHIDECPSELKSEVHQQSTCRGFGSIFDVPIMTSDVQIHTEESSVLKDSGERRQFASGAVRDIVKGKGRCDLMPLHIVAVYLDGDIVIEHIGKFLDDGEVEHLFDALNAFTPYHYNSKPSAILEVAKHYEAGAEKYGEHNWEKGIPLHSFIDSAIRHYLKCLRKDTDEPHDNAFIWNILGAIWTINNKPEMNDIKYLNDLK